MPDKEPTCPAHPVMEYKNNLAMGLLGANLLGVLVVAVLVGLALYDKMPSMEDKIMSKLEPLTERVAKVEQRVETLEQYHREKR